MQPDSDARAIPNTVGFESNAPLAVSQVPDDPGTWETTAPLIFHSRTGRILDVPIGSLTDWASRPQLLAWLINRWAGAAGPLGHDYCYRVLCPAGEMSYREADALLEEMLAALDEIAARAGRKKDRIRPATRWLMWAAVRWASILTRPGGAKGALRDIPRLTAITVPGLILTAPAVVLLPPTGLLWAANRLASIRP